MAVSVRAVITVRIMRHNASLIGQNEAMTHYVAFNVLLMTHSALLFYLRILEVQSASRRIEPRRIPTLSSSRMRGSGPPYFCHPCPSYYLSFPHRRESSQISSARAVRMGCDPVLEVQPWAPKRLNLKQKIMRVCHMARRSKAFYNLSLLSKVIHNNFLS